MLFIKITPDNQPTNHVADKGYGVQVHGVGGREVPIP